MVKQRDFGKHIPARSLLVAGLCLVAGATLFSFGQKQTPPQQRDDVIRVDSTLVTLPVRVVDRQGKIVADLKRDNFHVYEDGVEQEIAYFDSPTMNSTTAATAAAKPLTIALLLDVSDSAERKLGEIQAAALAFLDLLRSEDRVMIVAFDSRVQILADPTNNRMTLREAIKRTRSGNSTGLYLTLQTIISDRLNHVSGRKAIVLLTDGVDTASKNVTSDNTIRLAEQSYVAIYPVQYNTYADFADNASRETYGAGDFGAISHVTKNGEPASEAYKRATLYLRLLADKTGGSFQYSDRSKNLARSFERIAVQLRNEYALGYYPKNKTEEGRERKLKVTVDATNLRIETRKSYVYKSLNQ